MIKKTILMLLVLVGGVMQMEADTTTKTIRFVARDEVGLGNNNRGLWIYVSSGDSYQYATDGTSMNLLGWDGSANWWEVFLDIPVDKLKTLQWYYSNKTSEWGAGQNTYSSGAKNCESDSYVSYLYAGSSGEPQGISVEKVTFYMVNPDSFTDKYALTGNGVDYEGNISVSTDKKIVIIPDYLIVNDAIRSSNCWQFVYRANPDSGDDYWVSNWTIYNATAITASGTSKRWLFKPLAGTNGYNVKFNVNTKAYTIKPYIERSFSAYTTYQSTFSSDYNVAIPDGVTAYWASEAGTNSVTMKPFETSEMNAADAAFLKAEDAGPYKFTPATSSTSVISGNKMKKPASNGTVTTGYVFAKQGSSVGFFKVPSGGVTGMTGKAYLDLTSSAPELSIDFDDETTSIDVINHSSVINDNVYYDLSGRRIAEPTKGIYIVNGKKVVVK